MKVQMEIASKDWVVGIDGWGSRKNHSEMMEIFYIVMGYGLCGYIYLSNLTKCALQSMHLTVCKL